MRRFRFPLQTLQDLREGKLDQQELKLAAAATAYNHEQGRLSANRASSAQTWQSQDGLEPSVSHSGYLYLDRLEKEAQEIDGKMHEAHLAFEVEQKEYNVMRKDLHILKKLREKQYQKYKQDLHKAQDEAIAERCRAKNSTRVHTPNRAEVRAGFLGRSESSLNEVSKVNKVSKSASIIALKEGSQ